MTTSSVVRGRAAIPNSVDSRVDVAAKKLGQGAMIGRSAYLKGLAATVFELRYEAAVPYQPILRNGTWAQPPVDHRAAAKVSVNQTVSSGTGSAKITAQVTHDGERGNLRFSRGGAEVPGAIALAEPAFQRAVVQLGRILATELIRLDPTAKL